VPIWVAGLPSSASAVAPLTIRPGAPIAAPPASAAVAAVPCPLVSVSSSAPAGSFSGHRATSTASCAATTSYVVSVLLVWIRSLARMCTIVWPAIGVHSTVAVAPVANAVSCVPAPSTTNHE